MRIFTSLFLAILLLLTGAVGGYVYYAKYKVPKQEVVATVAPATCSEKAPTSNAVDQNNKIKTGMKINLLQDYTNFVFKPKEEIGDPQQYVQNMSLKVAAIGDDQLSAKFAATGDENNREKSILDFLNFLIDDIKTDLN